MADSIENTKKTTAQTEQDFQEMIDAFEGLFKKSVEDGVENLAEVFKHYILLLERQKELDKKA